MSINDPLVIASIVIPYVLLHFIIDYLSDSRIVKDELKLGILQFIHHFIAQVGFFGILIPTNNIKYISGCFLCNICIQIGFLINKDRCWYTRMINKIIDPNQPDFIRFRNIYSAFIRHYIRGNSWGYSEAYFKNSTTVTSQVLQVTIFFIIVFLRLIKKR